jgi:hypothetical protein
MNSESLIKYWKRNGLNVGYDMTNVNYIRHPAITSFFDNLTIKLSDTNPPNNDMLDIRNDLDWKLIQKFRNWIQRSNNNNIDISHLESDDLVHTIYDCIHEAGWRYRHRKLRKLRGDHCYLDNTFFYVPIEETIPTVPHHEPYLRYIDGFTGKYFDLDEDDWVYLTIPFFGNGDISDKLEGILNQADLLSVPVVVDCTLLPLAKGIDINLNHSSVKEVIFPLSTTLGIHKCQIGIRFSNYANTSADNGADGSDAVGPIHLLNQSDEGLVSTVELLIAHELLDNFTIDYMYDTCKNAQQEICHEINLIPTKCVNICMIPEPASSNDSGLWSSEKSIIELYNKHIDAGNDAYPRVDISSAISNKLKEKHNNE